MRACVLLRRADVAHEVWAARRLPAREFLRRDARYVVRFMDLLAEELAWHVAAFGERTPVVLPATDATGEDAYVRIAEAAQRSCCAQSARVPLPAVAHDNGCVHSRDEFGDPQFELAAWQEGCPEDVPPMGLPRFTYIEQRVLRVGFAQRGEAGHRDQGGNRLHGSSIRHAASPPQRAGHRSGLNFRILKSTCRLLRCVNRVCISFRER